MFYIVISLLVKFITYSYGHHKGSCILKLENSYKIVKGGGCGLEESCPYMVSLVYL